MLPLVLASGGRVQSSQVMRECVFTSLRNVAAGTGKKHREPLRPMDPCRTLRRTISGAAVVGELKILFTIRGDFAVRVNTLLTYCALRRRPMGNLPCTR
jgi:hypothetical protein